MIGVQREAAGPRDFSGGARGPDEDIKVNANVNQNGSYGGPNQQWMEQPDYNFIGMACIS